jgi:hypothetical protein
MLDYCATHDRRRIDRAVDLWLQALDAVPLQATDMELSGARSSLRRAAGSPDGR